MLTKDLLTPILDDEALTRGLGDAEARMLIEWLVEQAERCADVADASARVRQLCRWGRAIGRFVYLWCHAGLSGPAIQLAASERFNWPLPATWMEPCELMEEILAHEGRGQEEGRLLYKAEGGR
jgi:hypothetical protein